MRVSDEDRDHAAETLRDHAAAGRLTLDELSDRLQAAFTASTHAELDQQFADLPQAPRSHTDRHLPVTRARMPIYAVAYLCASLAMIAIWAATGSGYFWPIWPIMGWGIGVMSRLSADERLPVCNLRLALMWRNAGAQPATTSDHRIEPIRQDRSRSAEHQRRLH